MDKEKKVCKTCDGSGQISYFQKVSRFLIAENDCPERGGMDFTILVKKNHLDQPQRERERKRNDLCL